MVSISSLTLYVLIFLSVYVQVFFLITLLENRKKIIIRKNQIKLAKYPGVTIIVPCWNEEKTVYKTVRSLFNLNYPKNKLHIFLIDDGSTDNTYGVISSFAKFPNVRVFKKENGGKHTALNLGLASVETEFLGCLDADSFAHPESLVRIMSYFENDPRAMAVVPSVNVFGAKNIIQKAQKAEYHMGVFMKKMLDFLGAINVTPGPLTIFRKKVFTDLGPYRHAHNTEDMEIAYRMQEHDYKIVHCNDAYVFTGSPGTIPKLYKQRLRWIYGFINNTLDYRHIWLKKKYGNFALFTLPTGIVSILAVGYVFTKMVYEIGGFLYDKFIQIQTVGFDLNNSASSFDPFYIETNMSLFLVMIIYGSVMLAILIGGKMSEGKFKFSLDMIYFLVLFRLIAPFWIMKAVYKTVVGRAPDWR
ncbi:MAG: glycosyltransferase [Candidatus Paceibacterota bacterium]